MCFIDSPNALLFKVLSFLFNTKIIKFLFELPQLFTPMKLSTPLTEGNQLAVTNQKYQKAIKEINKLILINR